MERIVYKKNISGHSLLERLRTTYVNMYESDPEYMTMLVQNFRSDPDILSIPNELFYGNNLKVKENFCQQFEASYKPLVSNFWE